VVSEAKLFEILFEGNPHLAGPLENRTHLQLGSESKRLLTNARFASYVAEMRQVELRGQRNFAFAATCAARRSQKMPGIAGHFDEFLF
jgi:hypothetical protein